VSKHAAEENGASSPTTWITLDTESLDGKRKYAGKFKYRVPNMGERVDIDTMRAQYTQQITNVSGTGQRVAEALAYLYVTIDAATAPQWWKDSQGGIELYDFQPLLSLYASARAYEATFLGGGKAADADSEGDGDKLDPDADGGMESDVPVPAKRRTILATLGEGSDRTDRDAPRAGINPSGTAGEGDG
jgi:hypothetical protein